MIDLSKYLYKTSFSSEIKVFEPSEEDKFLSKASLENLKQYFPADIKIDESPDLLYIAMPSFNGGIINKNGDGVTKETAIILAEQFKNKYINLEHDRRIVVGNILDYGFARHGENTSITKEEALANDEPIDVILSGYIWKIIDEKLADLIVESADENSLKKNMVSASWEILYSDYDICVGSEIVSKAKIITDSTEFQIYSGYLKSNGGRGIDPEGQPVYKIIKGDCLPVGLGMVRKPAGLVSGVSVLQEDQEKQNNMKKDSKAEEISTIQVPDWYPIHPNHYVELCDCGATIFQCRCNVADKPTSVIKAGCKDCEAKASLAAQKSADNEEVINLSDCTPEQMDQAFAKLQNIVDSGSKVTVTVGEKLTEKELEKYGIKNKISKENKKSVNDITDLTVEQKLAVAKLQKDKNQAKINKNMKFKDLTKETFEALAATDAYEVAVELNKSMTHFAEQRDAKTKELEAAAAEYEKLKSESAETAKQLESVKADLAKMEEARAKEKVQTDFNLRMADLNEKFELDADKSKSIAKQIRGLDDETFATWLEDHKAFLVAKKVEAGDDESDAAAKKKGFVPFGKKAADEEDKKDGGDDEDMENPDGSKKAKAKKAAKASLLDEIKNLKSETPELVQKIQGNRSIQDLVAAAFDGVGEDKKESK